MEPVGVPVVGGTGESAVAGSVPVDDGAEGEAEAGRGAPTACPGNERAGELADVDPPAVRRVAGRDE